MQEEGLVKHLGISTVSAEQIAEARSIAPVVCVQNYYNLAHRIDDDLIESLATHGIAYVPYFLRWVASPPAAVGPHSGSVATPPGRHTDGRRVSPGCCSARSNPNILLIPGTSSSVAHLARQIHPRSRARPTPRTSSPN